jgi:glycosyltransferase involved in cell wall biosynthesis
VRASVVIPAYNAEKLLPECLKSLSDQTVPRDDYEIIVVDDGSTDSTAGTAVKCDGVRVVRQKNQGPAAARNQGARMAKADIILFTDSDCVPERDWVERMLEPFDGDPKLAGDKGRYLTSQRELAARFVQAEYQDKYRLLEKHREIDFIDTYSAGFRRDTFLRYGGYDTSFPVACAEDVELSFRMSNGGEKMVYVPKAVVYHRHPNSWPAYFLKKYKFAYWRMLAVRKNPNKAIKDSHTPQLMKLQLLLAPFALAALAAGIFISPLLWLAAVMAALFLVSSLPFALREGKRDTAVGLAAPAALYMRALYQFAGVAVGSLDLFLLGRHDRTVGADSL